MASTGALPKAKKLDIRYALDLEQDASIEDIKYAIDLASARITNYVTQQAATSYKGVSIPTIREYLQTFLDIVNYKLYPSRRLQRVK